MDRRFLMTPISPNQAKDAGLVLALITSIAGLKFQNIRYSAVTGIIVLATLIYPRLFSPFARIWYGLSNIIGMVVSRLILSLVFFVLITPVGLVRRLLGIDSLKLDIWHKHTQSVFINRNHRFTPNDIRRPF